MAYEPGPGVSEAYILLSKRDALPKPHVGALRPRDVACLPMDELRAYTPGPGVFTCLRNGTRTSQGGVERGSVEHWSRRAACVARASRVRRVCSACGRGAARAACGWAGCISAVGRTRPVR